MRRDRYGSFQRYGDRVRRNYRPGGRRVMTGGPGPARAVSHEELLDLETEYFQSLVFDPRTRARMLHMLEHGTPLRN